LSSFRIALVNGDAAIRAGKRLLIDSQADMKVVYEESIAAKALEVLPELLVDVVVIDHRLQGMDGVSLSKQLIARLSASEQRLPTIVITGAYFTSELLMASIRAGRLSWLHRMPRRLICSTRYESREETWSM